MIRKITVTPTISGSAAYSVNDALGEKLEFAKICSQAGGSIIRGITIVDKAQQRAIIDLFLFDRDFTAVPNHAPFVISDDDLVGKLLGVATISGIWKDISDNELATLECALPFTISGTSLYGQLRVRTTPTFASASDIAVTILFEA